MSRFNVHAFVVVRVKVADIEAPGIAEAVEIAEQKLNELDGVIDFDRESPSGAGRPEIAAVAYQGDDPTRYYLVDPLLEDGEVDYDKSHWFDGGEQVLAGKSNPLPPKVAEVPA